MRARKHIYNDNWEDTADSRGKSFPVRGGSKGIAQGDRGFTFPVTLEDLERRRKWMRDYEEWEREQLCLARAG